MVRGTARFVLDDISDIDALFRQFLLGISLGTWAAGVRHGEVATAKGHMTYEMEDWPPAAEAACDVKGR